MSAERKKTDSSKNDFFSGVVFHLHLVIDKTDLMPSFQLVSYLSCNRALK